MPYYCPSCYSEMKKRKLKGKNKEPWDVDYELKCPSCGRIEDPDDVMMPDIPSW